MFYNDPNDMWQHHQLPDDIDPDDAVTIGCLQGVGFVVMFIIALAICAMFSSCTTTKYVPMVETHEEHHWHTDSIYQTDSIIRETNTTIMQLDSAAMAQYGIQLRSAERAWLVRTQELERQLQQMARLIQDRDTVHDSIPYPVPVIQEVPAQLTWWQEARQHIANILLYLLGMLAAYWLIKKKLLP